jgi:hypothetical protein
MKFFTSKAFFVVFAIISLASLSAFFVTRNSPKYLGFKDLRNDSIREWTSEKSDIYSKMSDGTKKEATKLASTYIKTQETGDLESASLALKGLSDIFQAEAAKYADGSKLKKESSNAFAVLKDAEKWLLEYRRDYPLHPVNFNKKS